MTARKIIHLIMAARPNIMKVAPIYHAIKGWDGAEVRLVHTGQHYDDNMSGAFLRDFGLPQPDHHLGVGSGTYAEQTARTMIAYESLCLEHRPDLVVVVGDVNATLACTITAKKLNLKVAHLEAGLRSFDRTMPEEVNRIVTDGLCDWYWTPSPDATAQLLKEGIAPAAIAEVGNVMIDAYHMLESRVLADDTRTRMGLEGDYVVATFHRPGNVDVAGNLVKIADLLAAVADMASIVFPVHPRTRSKLQAAGLIDRMEAHPRIILSEPLTYIPFMNLITGARLSLTDSGGVQEETSYLGIPCLTLRPNTERPITITHGTNRLVELDTALDAVRGVMAAPAPARPVIPGWDGHAAGRVAAQLRRIMA